jgi:hypothetical protein
MRTTSLLISVNRPRQPDKLNAMSSNIDQQRLWSSRTRRTRHLAQPHLRTRLHRLTKHRQNQCTSSPQAQLLPSLQPRRPARPQSRAQSRTCSPCAKRTETLPLHPGQQSTARRQPPTTRRPRSRRSPRARRRTPAAPALARSKQARSVPLPTERAQTRPLDRASGSRPLLPRKPPRDRSPRSALRPSRGRIPTAMHTGMRESQLASSKKRQMRTGSCMVYSHARCQW